MCKRVRKRTGRNDRLFGMSISIVDWLETIVVSFRIFFSFTSHSMSIAFQVIVVNMKSRNKHMQGHHVCVCHWWAVVLVKVRTILHRMRTMDFLFHFFEVANPYFVFVCTICLDDDSHSSSFYHCISAFEHLKWQQRQNENTEMFAFCATSKKPTLSVNFHCHCFRLILLLLSLKWVYIVGTDIRIHIVKMKQTKEIKCRCAHASLTETYEWKWQKYAAPKWKLIALVGLSVRRNRQTAANKNERRECILCVTRNSLKRRRRLKTEHVYLAHNAID